MMRNFALVGALIGFVGSVLYSIYSIFWLGVVDLDLLFNIVMFTAGGAFFGAVDTVEGTLLHLLGPDLTGNPFMALGVQVDPRSRFEGKSPSC